MDQTLVYVSAPDEGYVEMARSRTGRLFRKQILKYGTYAHPNDPATKLTVDEAMADSLIDNFHRGIADIVQFPVVDDKNRHVEDPLRNLGEVVDVVKDGKGVYVTLDVRKNADDVGKTLLGASAMIHQNYMDTRTGKKVGPTLLHVAGTNRPYLTDLEDFEEIIAASADTIGDERPVILTEEQGGEQQEEHMPTKEELIAALRDEHGIDVEALQEQSTSAPSQQELVEAMSNVLKDAGVLSLAGKGGEGEDELTVVDVAEAVVELSQERAEQNERIQVLELSLAKETEGRLEQEIDGYVTAGRILPAQREGMLKLAAADRDHFDSILPDKSIVDFGEKGVEIHDETTEKLEEDVDRLVTLANSLQTGGK